MANAALVGFNPALLYIGFLRTIRLVVGRTRHGKAETAVALHVDPRRNERGIQRPGRAEVLHGLNVVVLPLHDDAHQVVGLRLIVYSMCGECEDILPLNTSTHNEGVDSDDYGFAVFRYRNGVSFVKACASEVNGFGRRQIVVTGTKGSVVIEPIEQRTGRPQVETYVTAHVTFYDEGIQHRFGNSGTDMTFGPFGRYTEMMEDFAQIVRGERETRFGYEDELAVQRMLLKACGNWKGEN